MRVPTDEKYNILIVEDSATLRQMVTMALQERGYNVTGAADGITGLHALAEHTPDAILLDLNLPDIDGFALCKRIKSEPRGRNIPILVMTSLGESGFEFFSGVAVEHHCQDFIGLAESGLDGVANLGHDGRTLAGACCGNQQVAILHDNRSPALFIGKRSLLHTIEKGPMRVHFVLDESLITLVNDAGLPLQNIHEHLDLRL